MIKVNSITKYYLVQKKKRLVFDNLSLQFNSGDRIALMGANGAGKSTLMRLLSGIELPNHGNITRTSTLSWPIGVHSGFMLTLTGRENCKFVCRLFKCSRAEQSQKISFIQDFAEINDYFDMPVASYSSGMMSRLAFGMSMAFDFDFYLVDETLSVGDQQFQKKCLEVFTQKAQDKGIIMASHAMDTVRKFCNKGIYIGHSGVVFSENLEEILALYASNGASRVFEGATSTEEL